MIGTQITAHETLCLTSCYFEQLRTSLYSELLISNSYEWQKWISQTGKRIFKQIIQDQHASGGSHYLGTISVVHINSACQLELPPPILWNQTSDVHRGAILIMRCWCYITWRGHHRDHGNTVTSVIAAKKNVVNDVYVISIKYRLSDILLKNT